MLRSQLENASVVFNFDSILIFSMLKNMEVFNLAVVLC